MWVEYSNMENKLDINKISADVITDLAKTTAQTVYKKIVNYITDIQKKEEIEFGYAYENYLNYAKSIHEKIKTLLYRHSPKEIYSFYECVGLDRNGGIVDASDVNNILEIGKKLLSQELGGLERVL